MAVITTPAEFVTRTLGAKDFTNPNDNTQATSIATALSNAIAKVKGQVLGPEGHFAFFASSANVFSTSPVSVQGIYSDSYAVPCGYDFEILVQAGQQVFAMGSISPSVPWGGPDDIISVAYSVAYLSLEEVITDTRRSATVLPPPPPQPPRPAPAPLPVPQPSAPTTTTTTPSTPTAPIPELPWTPPTSFFPPLPPGIKPPDHHEPPPMEEKPKTIRGPKARWLKSGKDWGKDKK